MDNLVYTYEDKTNIAELISDYGKKHNLTQKELIKRTNVSYLNSILNGNFTYKNARTGEVCQIKDSYFKMLADFVQYKPQGVWRYEDTTQSKIIIDALNDSKTKQEAKTIFAQTGCGKTFITKCFMRLNPVGTFYVKCNPTHTIPSLLDFIIKASGLNCFEKSAPYKLEFIKNEFIRMYYEGIKPHLIFDEAENMKIRTIQLFKSIYDETEGQMGLTFCGTYQLACYYKKLSLREEGEEGNAQSFPQFFSRTSTGIVKVPLITETKHIDFPKFYRDRNLTDDAKKLLTDNCNDYRQLNKILEPCLIEAQGQPIDARFILNRYPILYDGLAI